MKSLIITLVIIVGAVITLYSFQDISRAGELPVKGAVSSNINTIPVENFRVPKYIPAGYELYTSSNAPPHILELEFALKDRDTEGVTPNDAIVFVADKDDPNVQKGEQAFLDYKAKSQRGDLIQIFKINGNPAMG